MLRRPVVPVFVEAILIQASWSVVQEGAKSARPPFFCEQRKESSVFPLRVRRRFATFLLQECDVFISFHFNRDRVNQGLFDLSKVSWSYRSLSKVSWSYRSLSISVFDLSKVSWSYRSLWGPQALNLYIM